MKRILGVGAAALLAGAPVFGQTTSKIEYFLLVGGDNHAADYENINTQAYSGGTEVDGVYQIDKSVDPVGSWAVRVLASGAHDPDGDGPLIPIDIAGVANVVWDLELLGPDGKVVGAPDSIYASPFGLGSPTTPGFFSTINDGDDDGLRGGFFGADPLAAAAFAFKFIVDGSPAVTPGTLIMDTDNNGPGMARSEHPSTYGFPAGSTADSGTLVGMGAGYTSFFPNLGIGDKVAAGVGLVSGDGYHWCFLGDGPIAEGQINFTGLPNGTYTLVLNPGQGNNALWLGEEDFCDGGREGSFAVGVAPGSVIGDSITFEVIGPGGCDAPAMVSAESVKSHGGTEFGIPLPIASGANAGVECRINGPTKIVVTYDKAIGGTPNVVASAGSVDSTSISGNQLTINMSGVANGTCVALTINGVACDTGDGVAAAHAITVGAVYGDVNGNRSVNAGDVGLVKFNSGNAVSPTTFVYDLNANGAINAGDVGLVKFQSGTGSIAACANP